MGEKIRVWLDGDHSAMHHAEANQFPDLTVLEAPGETDCARQGVLRFVLPELVDTGLLCEECIAISGVAPALAGESLGPV